MPAAPYYWNYVPLLLQILVAVGLGAGMVTASWFIGRHRNSKAKLAMYECGIVAEGDARGRFSVKFYMVAMLFILGDGRVPWLCRRGSALHHQERGSGLVHRQG
jgi:NADH-quinone oxidoreductase subunit A